MNRHVKLFASLLTLVPAGFLQAATETKPAMPVIAIQQVETDDSTTYAMWIARNNEAIKARLGIDKYYHVYLGQAAGEESGAVFTVAAADSFATLAKNGQILMEDPALVESRAHLDTVRELGKRTLLKAVRYEGRNTEGWLYNTQATMSDEAGYLKAIDQLRALFDSHELKDARINVYRVIAGRENYTHLISINLPSSERLAAFLDAVGAESWAAEWIAASAKFRTVVRNGTYREITR
jgi:hypothetical protein